MDCFEKVLTYSMPGYVSRDVTRTLSLVYRSNQAHPVGTVVLLVSDPSLSLAAKVGVKLLKPDNSLETFLNNRQELFFEASAVPSQMILQFAAHGGVTRRVSYRAVVTSYWADGTQLADTVSAPAMIIDESTSPYGAGVRIGGAQRVQRVPEGTGVIVTDGWGGASFFSGPCDPAAWTPCTFNPPAPGEFSTMYTANGMYYRNYPDGTVVVFSPEGYHWTTTDRFGATTTYAHTQVGPNLWALQSVQDPAGISTYLGYADPTDYWKPGTLRWIGENFAEGRHPWFGVDMSGNLIHLMNADGTYFGYAGYDTDHRMMVFQDGNSNVWNFNYANNGTLSQVQAPVTDLGGGATGRPTTTIAAPGVAVLSTLQSAPDSPVSSGTERRAIITNPRGFSTAVDVNHFGSALATTDALNRTSTIDYDLNGLPKLISPVGATPVEYDWSGPLLTRSQVGNTTVYHSYNPVYGQLEHTWGSTAEEWLTYDTTKVGRPLLSVRTGSTPADSATRFVFTADGRIQSQIDALGDGTTWTYDPAGFQNTHEVRTIAQVGDKKTTFTSDQYGRPATVTDATGAVTRLQYDLLNNPWLTIGPRNDTTGFNYDANHHLIEVIDGRHQSFHFAPNVLGWNLSQTDPNNAVQYFAYNPNGGVVSYTNRRNQTGTTTYDALDRVLSFHQAEGQTTTYGYDPAGRWTAVANGLSADTVVLDAAYLVTKQVTARAAGFKRTVRASYDWQQQRTGVNVLLNDVAGDSIAYGYGAAGELRTIRDPLANVTTFGYNSDLLMNSVAYAGGVVATMDYSATHGLASTAYSNSIINGAFGRGYREDSLSRVSEVQSGSSAIRRFAYDSAGQLASYADVQTTLTCHFDKDLGRVCTQNPETTVGGDSYAYDQVGNRRRAGDTTAWNNRLVRAGGDTLIYDADGNLTHRYRIGSPSTFDQSLSWNSIGQLTQVTTTRSGTTFTLQFGYDGLGRRITKTVPGNSSIHYVWDGDQVVVETDGGGRTLRSYTYRPGIDQLHSVTTGPGGQTYYAASDASGNVIGTFSRNTNAVSDAYAYTPFGSITQDGYNVPQSLRWKGLQYDSESGLYYVRSRYYAPDLGRFISEDPIGLAGGVNAYAYAGNDPINFSDPSGMDCTAAEAERVSYTRNEDGDWVETRTCPAGMGRGGITVIGHGLPSGLLPSAPTGPTGPTMPTCPSCTGPGVPGGPTATPTPRTTQPTPKATNPEFNDCAAGNFISGVLYGTIGGAWLGLRAGLRPAMLRAGTAGIVGGALTVEFAGSGAVPAYLTTFVGTLATYTTVGAVGGGIAGGAAGIADSFRPGGSCTPSLR